MVSRYFLYFLCICVVIVPNLNNGKLLSEVDSKYQFIRFSLNLQVHDPIHIGDDEDLRIRAVDENWDLNGTRDGSQAKPYVISNLSVTESSEKLIWLQDTTLYVQIENNFLFGGGTGISLWNTENILISNNYIDNNSASGIDLQGTNTIISNNHIENNRIGITLFGHEHAIIIENDIIGNSWKGIGIEDFDNVSIVRNQVYENGEGMEFLMFTRNTLVYDNEIYDNNECGIFMGDNFLVNITNNRIHHNARNGIQYEFAFGNSIIDDNLIFDNGISGIEIFWATSFRIVKNFISNHSQYGIAGVDDCHNLTISMNTITNSESYGIYLSSFTSGNHIQKNNFFNNSNLELAQAFDSGLNNIFATNFWDEWTLPDDDGDNCVDIPYRIDGEVDNYDPFPLASPYQSFLSTYPTQFQDTTTDMTTDLISDSLIYITTNPLLPNIFIVVVFIYLLKKKQR